MVSNINSNSSENNIGKNGKTNTTTILKAAWIIAVVTIFSKALGFIRDIIVANYYGATTVSDAYFYAYQIPALAVILLGGVGGPFHSATVAVFSKIIPNFNVKAPEHAKKLFSTFVTASFVFFFILAVLFFIFANQIMSIIISGENNANLIALAAKHLQIMSPTLLIGGLVGIMYGILVTYNEFLIPNISPMMVSLVIIGTLMVTGGDKTGYVLAGATMVGACCQLLLQLPKVIKIGFNFKPNFEFFNNPDFKAILELLFPAVLSSTVGQIHIYVDMFFASLLEEGAWTAIGFANRIFQFPVGILVTAFLVPLFPVFSKLVAQKDFEGIKNYFNKGVGVLFLAAIPVIIGIICVGQDAVALVFQRGAFDSNATFMVTEALWFLSFSILPYVFRDSITRLFYSFNDSKTPFIIAFSSIILKVVLNMILVKPLGIAGITLSTSLVTLFNAVMLGFLISKHLKLDYISLFKNFLKMLISGFITFVICFMLSNFMDKLNINLKVLEIIKICTIAVVCIIIYISLNLIFKNEYVIELKKRLVKDKK